jgi:hypothetical protein
MDFLNCRSGAFLFASLLFFKRRCVLGKLAAQIPQNKSFESPFRAISSSLQNATAHNLDRGVQLLLTLFV